MEQLIDRIAKAPLAVKIGVVVGAVVLVTVLNFFLFIQDIETEIEHLRNQQAELNKQLAEKQEIAQNLNERRKEMDLLEQKLAEALTELPENKDIEELLAQLNDVGKKSGLEISRVQPGPESAQGFVAAIPIQMSVNGNYHEVAMFLQEVANLRRIVAVQNIRFTVAQGKSDKVILNSEFLATTFRFAPGQQPPGKP